MDRPENKKLTPQQALQKIKHYCAYQERSHEEVKQRLYSFGLRTIEVDPILARLIEEDYLNEERFARLFAGGRFRMKQWGRVKIRLALRQRNVSEYCIRKGLSEIPDNEYLHTLRRLFTAKWNALKGEKNLLVKKRKALDALLQKGFERDLVMDLLKEI